MLNRVLPGSYSSQIINLNQEGGAWRAIPPSQVLLRSFFCLKICMGPRDNFQQLSNQIKIRIFWHVLDVFSVLSDRIKSIPFHERPASHGTSLEYHQQGNRSNLKIHFFRLRGVLRGP